MSYRIEFIVVIQKIFNPCRFSYETAHFREIHHKNLHLSIFFLPSVAGAKNRVNNVWNNMFLRFYIMVATRVLREQLFCVPVPVVPFPRKNFSSRSRSPVPEIFPGIPGFYSRSRRSSKAI